MRVDRWFKSSPGYDLSTKEDDHDHPVLPSMSMEGVTFAEAQILAQTIISVNFIMKGTIKNASNLHLKSNILTTLSILSNFTIILLIIPILSVFVVEKMQNIWYIYLCTICEIYMHPISAMKSIPFVIDQPKRHDHSLTLFPRQTSLTYKVCGLLKKLHPTFVCLICNFFANILYTFL